MLSFRSLMANHPTSLFYRMIRDSTIFHIMEVSQCVTPAIDALTQETVVLRNYYTTSVCSPTRTTLLTGRHAIHTGVYNVYGGMGGNNYSNTSFSLLPTYLKNCCNYATHMIGKWHLGFNLISRLPTLVDLIPTLDT